MKQQPRNITGLIVAGVASVLLAGCGGGGASDAEFVAACLEEGQGLASQMLDKELGITREQFCTCGAGVARSTLSADGYRAMVLEMQGRGQEASSITSKMSDAEQMAGIQVAAGMLEKCAGVKPE